jgi:poly-gamma-glutamate synthesis protein (capsule biosynthesis protein)
VRGTRIAYLAYTYPLDAARMTADIAAVRPNADVVVVSLHLGTEYESMHNAVQERAFHAAADAGADLVVGTHPHVVQDAEHYHGAWLFYSLGNFVFDQNWSDATRHGLMLSVTVQSGRIVDVVHIPVEISRQYVVQ